MGNKEKLLEILYLMVKIRRVEECLVNLFAQGKIPGFLHVSIGQEATAVARRLFARGQEWARQRGLILVDTKYEMGTVDGKLVVIDEIHTPDSSRYWVADGYADRQRKGQDQEMLDKENIRQWLIKEHGFSGHGKPPPLTDEVRRGLDQARPVAAVAAMYAAFWPSIQTSTVRSGLASPVALSAFTILSFCSGTTRAKMFTRAMRSRSDWPFTKGITKNRKPSASPGTCSRISSSWMLLCL